MMLPLLVPAVAIAGNRDNTFKSVALGFEITKPAAWHYRAGQQTLERLNRVKLKGSEFRALLYEYAETPLVSITKYPPPYHGLNPSLKVSVRPFGKLLGDDPKQVLGLVSGQFAEAFEDYELIQAPMNGTVSGVESAYMRVHYTVRSPGGRTFPTASEIWVVPQDGYFYLISSGTRQDEATGTRAEIREIIKTIEFEHAAGHT